MEYMAKNKRERHIYIGDGEFPDLQQSVLKKYFHTGVTVGRDLHDKRIQIAIASAKNRLFHLFGGDLLVCIPWLTDKLIKNRARRVTIHLPDSKSALECTTRKNADRAKFVAEQLAGMGLLNDSRVRVVPAGKYMKEKKELNSPIRFNRKTK